MQPILKNHSVKTDSRIVLLVMDGLGGLPHPQTRKTELESAKKPNTDALAAESMLGLMDMVAPGITPGSGPGHLALFGYDPVQTQIGRGILSAMGIGFPVQKGDVALRGNFATVDGSGKITDRRAGRISTEECVRVCEKLQKEIASLKDITVVVKSEKEHRFVLVLRGAGLIPGITDTDPQKEGVPIALSKPLVPDSQKLSEIVNMFSCKAMGVLKNEEQANAVLLRGADARPDIPTLKDLYQLTPACVATYPMYRGLSRLVGMDILETSPEEDLTVLAKTLTNNFAKYDFFYVHVKKTDSYGEDGKFEDKVKVIERVDQTLIPAILELKPDVLAITGDHSSPATVKGHSWHPVPVLLHSRWNRLAGHAAFGETECARGLLGRFPAKELMSLMLAHARKLNKYGA